MGERQEQKEGVMVDGHWSHCRIHGVRIVNSEMDDDPRSCIVRVIVVFGRDSYVPLGAVNDDFARTIATNHPKYLFVGTSRHSLKSF